MSAAKYRSGAPPPARVAFVFCFLLQYRKRGIIGVAQYALVIYSLTDGGYSPLTPGGHIHGKIPSCTDGANSVHSSFNPFVTCSTICHKRLHVKTALLTIKTRKDPPPREYNWRPFIVMNFRWIFVEKKKLWTKSIWLF